MAFNFWVDFSPDDDLSEELFLSPEVLFVVGVGETVAGGVVGAVVGEEGGAVVGVEEVEALTFPIIAQ